MLKKIRSLSEKKRKIILWFLMIIIAAGFIYLFIKDTADRFSDFSAEKIKEGIDFPEIGSEIGELVGESLTGTSSQNDIGNK